MSKIDFQVEVREPATEATATTVIVNMRRIGVIARIKLLPGLLLYPWKNLRALRQEYRLWNQRGICATRFHRFAYVIDHFVLWHFYCVIAVFRGHMRGFKWRIHRQGTERNGL